MVECWMCQNEATWSLRPLMPPKGQERATPQSCDDHVAALMREGGGQRTMVTEPALEEESSQQVEMRQAFATSRQNSNGSS